LAQNSEHDAYLHDIAAHRPELSAADPGNLARVYPSSASDLGVTHRTLSDRSSELPVQIRSFFRSQFHANLHDIE
jgi:hypothetical protein